MYSRMSLNVTLDTFEAQNSNFKRKVHFILTIAKVLFLVKFIRAKPFAFNCLLNDLIYVQLIIMHHYPITL